MAIEQQDVEEHETDKLVIAAEFLVTASILWLAETSYFSAMHLAAAAEELTGKMCRILKKQSFHEATRQRIIRAYSVVGAPWSEEEIRLAMYEGKNSIKHMNTAADRKTAVDAKEEASRFISATCQNFHSLGLDALIPESAREVLRKIQIVIGVED